MYCRAAAPLELCNETDLQEAPTAHRQRFKQQLMLCLRAFSGSTCEPHLLALLMRRRLDRLTDDEAQARLSRQRRDAPAADHQVGHLFTRGNGTSDRILADVPEVSVILEMANVCTLEPGVRSIEPLQACLCLHVPS